MQYVAKGIFGSRTATKWAFRFYRSMPSHLRLAHSFDHFVGNRPAAVPHDFQSRKKGLRLQPGEQALGENETKRGFPLRSAGRCPLCLP